MDELLTLILDSLSFLYEKYGFRFSDSKVGKEFGDAYLTLSHDNVVFCFSRDRGQIFLDVGPPQALKHKHRYWYSFDLIRQLITKEKEYFPIMDESNIEFLCKNIDTVLAKFSKDMLKVTISELEKLKRIRAKLLFD